MIQNVKAGNIIRLDAATDVGWWMNVFEALPDATFISHAESGRIQVANSACKALLGYDVGYILGRTTMDLKMFESKSQRDALVDAALHSSSFVNSTFWTSDQTEKLGQFSIRKVEYAGAPTLINTIRVLENKSLEMKNDKLVLDEW